MISVIVPVYKVEAYLSRCVDSILNQTFNDFELILVDDGSPDNCGQICDEYAKKDKRIHVIHKENGGLSDARNAGIDWCFANSESQWIAFIDSDDWIHPQYLEALYFAAQKYNSSISVCSYKKVEKLTSFENIVDFNICNLDTENMYLNYSIESIIACAKLYKKEYFADVRYPVGKIHEDEYVTYKLLFQNEKIAFVNEQLYFYYYNSDSIINCKWSLKRLDVIEALTQQYEYFKRSKFKDVYIHTIEKNIWTLKNLYDNLINYNGDSEKKEYINLIRKKLRKYLRHREIKMPVEKNTVVYAIAYPRLINIFYFYKRVKKKLKRMLGSR